LCKHRCSTEEGGEEVGLLGSGDLREPTPTSGKYVKKKGLIKLGQRGKSEINWGAPEDTKKTL